jgi:HPt (histidine-containing phosphotransfer) domain-containing protein
MTNSVIDEPIFRELKETLGDDFIPELISTYLEETPLLITNMQQALAEGKAEAFGRAAHSIKSSSASLGALDFSAQARDLEMIGKSGDLGQAAEKFARLTAAYPELEQALKNLL